MLNKTIVLNIHSDIDMVKEQAKCLSRCEQSDLKIAFPSFMLSSVVACVSMKSSIIVMKPVIFASIIRE
jgi:hypothetical protein